MTIPAQRAAPPRQRPPRALLAARFPQAVLEVLRTLDAAGFRSWLVGGAVRDLVLRRTRPTADLDVATPARPEQVMALFRKVVPTGVEHGTVTVVVGDTPVEVTTFRGEGAYVDGRRPSSVRFLDDIDEDLARRDFTVNALAYDPIARAFRDPFGGRADLRRGVLRAVGDPAERFAEDGLRPVRAARFAAQLGFALDRTTAAAIRPALPVAARVSVERVTEEVSRLLVAPHARRGLDLLDRTGLVSVVLPEVAALPPGDRRHAFAAVEAAPRALAPRLAALLHLVARADPPLVAARRLRGVLERMRFSSAVCSEASALVAAHGCVLDGARAAGVARSPAAVRRWVASVGRERVPALLRLWAADAAAVRPASRARRERQALRAFRARLARVERSRPPVATAELALDGAGVMQVLALPPGRAVGEALRHLLDVVLEDPRLNTRQALTSELRAWWASRPSGT